MNAHPPLVKLQDAVQYAGRRWTVSEFTNDAVLLASGSLHATVPHEIFERDVLPELREAR